jgi:hypothetical protein
VKIPVRGQQVPVIVHGVLNPSRAEQIAFFRVGSLLAKPVYPLKGFP